MTTPREKSVSEMVGAFEAIASDRYPTEDTMIARQALTKARELLGE